MLTILCSDALEKLRELPAESVHCCVTSPPYWGLRDYGTAQWEGGGTECDHVSHEIRTGLGMAALELGRRAILIELNPTYIKLIKRRCDVTPGLALA